MVALKMEDRKRHRVTYTERKREMEKKKERVRNLDGEEKSLEAKLLKIVIEMALASDVSSQ